MNTGEAILTLAVMPLAHIEKLIEFHFLDILTAGRMCDLIFFG